MIRASPSGHRAKRPVSRLGWWRWYASLRALIVVLVSGWAVTSIVEAAQRPTLFVFLNTELKPHAVERSLEAALPEVSVTVFGRFKDFDESVREDKPDAVIALYPVVQSLQLPVVALGKRGGAIDEPYVCLPNIVHRVAA